MLYSLKFVTVVQRVRVPDMWVDIKCVAVHACVLYCLLCVQAIIQILFYYCREGHNVVITCLKVQSFSQIY